MLQKVPNELDQMYIEEDAESNDEDDYVELIEVPDLENALENAIGNVSENPTQKKNSVKNNFVYLW